jgi:hypothetical protein
MMCSLKKISLPGNQAAIVPAKYKTGRGSRTTEKEHRTSAETRKGTKTNRGGDRKGNAFSRKHLHSPP